MTQKGKVKNSDKNRQMLIIGGIVAAVVIVFVGVLIVANPSLGSFDYEGIPAERTADGAFILGDPDAPITVVAWEDFLCPHCQNYQSTLKQFFQEYVATGQARFEFRMLPISQQSGFIFSLVECAAEVSDDPAAFWPAHDAMFHLASTSGINLDGSDFADAIDVPYGSLLDCTETANQFTIDGTLANNFSEVTGTPSVGWRFGDGPVQFSIISRQPSFEELQGLMAFAAQQ